jgi:hypothetical protein
LGPSQEAIAAADLNNDDEIVLASLQKFTSERPQSCVSENAHDAGMAVARLEGRLASWYAAAIDRRRSNVERTMRFRTIDEMKPTVLNRKLDLADAYLHANCLDRADGIYRAVMEVYTGMSYASYRDRARIGIDDVRQKRSETRSPQVTPAK